MSGRQGSVPIAVLIDVQQRLRRADDQLDRLIRERNALAEQRNELDPLTYYAPRFLTFVDGVVWKKKD